MTRAPTPASHGQRRRDAAPGRPRYRKAPARARPLLHASRGRVRSPLLPCHGASAPAVPRSHASLSHARPREGWDVCTPPHGHPWRLPSTWQALRQRSANTRRGRAPSRTRFKHRRVSDSSRSFLLLCLHPDLGCTPESLATHLSESAFPPRSVAHTRPAWTFGNSAPPGSFRGCRPPRPSLSLVAALCRRRSGHSGLPPDARGTMCLPVPRALAPAGPAAWHDSPPPPPVAHLAAVTSRCAVRRSLWEAPWGSDGPRWATPPVSQWLGHAFGSRLHHRAGPAAAADGRSQGR